MKPYPLLRLALSKSTPEKSMGMAMKESEDEERKIKVDWFNFLPDDILLEILKRVPRSFLRCKVKYVCTQWFDIITNRILQDHASLMLQHMQEVRPHQLVDISEEGHGHGIQLKTCHLKIPKIGAIRHWCNEFLLISIPHIKTSLYVLNLTTNKGSYLPQCKARCLGHYNNTCGMALSLGVYLKHMVVVHLFMGPPVYCEICVLGRARGIGSKWKKIQLPYMDIGEHIMGDVVSVEGRYMHWKIQDTNDMISVDMVKEKVCRISLPGSSDLGRYVNSIFEMDGFVTYIDGVTTSDKAEIWVLNDFHRVRWEKVHSITVNNSYFEMQPPFKHLIYRVCCMIRKRYIIMESRLKSRAEMFCYDLKHGVMKHLNIPFASPGDVVWFIHWHQVFYNS